MNSCPIESILGDYRKKFFKLLIVVVNTLNNMLETGVSYWKTLDCYSYYTLEIEKSFFSED
jgi:hypothetical protein